MGYRPDRVGHLIRQIVAEAIQARLNDPRIEPLTSITRVNVSADLSLARVNVSVFATPARQQLTLTALKAAANRLRAIVRDRLVARHIPRLEFYLDDSIKRGTEIINTLDEVLPPPPPPAADDTDTAAPDDPAGPARSSDAASTDGPGEREDG